MIALCFRGLLPLLCLACVTSFVQSEDNVGQQALDDDDADSFFRYNRQFYRFGRAFSPLWDTDDDRKNHLVHWAGYPVSPVLDNDAFTRSNREFYRFGRAYPPYQDKRFLRFGRSVQSETGEYPHYLFVHPDNQLYRKRRSLSPGSQSDALKTLAGQSEAEKSAFIGKELQKRATTPEEAKTDDQLSYNIVLNAEEDKDKRFMRFGKRFMRFGRGDEDDEELNKRFMRFGKRFMRFGRSGDDEDQMEDKRFMRFGKRFMRFGRGDEQDQEEDKRFMRFGKSRDSDEDYDKRFMRFGKRFMRFGRGYEDDDNDLTNAEKEVEDKRFMRFGKRSKRESAKELSSNSVAAAAALVAS